MPLGSRFSVPKKSLFLICIHGSSGSIVFISERKFILAFSVALTGSSQYLSDFIKLL